MDCRVIKKILITYDIDFIDGYFIALFRVLTFWMLIFSYVWLVWTISDYTRAQNALYFAIQTAYDGINDYGKFDSILTIDLSLYPQIIHCLSFLW